MEKKLNVSALPSQVHQEGISGNNSIVSDMVCTKSFQAHYIYIYIYTYIYICIYIYIYIYILLIAVISSHDNL